MNNSISQDEREPKQIFDDEDFDEENHTLTTTLAQFSGTSGNLPDMQCCACPGPTPTLSSMFDNNSDSVFATLNTESDIEETTITSDELKTTTLNDLQEFETTTNEIDDDEIKITTTTESMKPRDGKTLDFNQENETTKTNSKVNDNPLLNYLERLQRIYELDLKILGRLKHVNMYVLKNYKEVDQSSAKLSTGTTMVLPLQYCSGRRKIAVIVTRKKITSTHRSSSIMAVKKISSDSK